MDGVSMNNRFSILISFSLLMIAATISGMTQSAYAAPIDLNTWEQEGPAGNGNWVVAGDGLSVLQTINNAPTFFVSPDSVIDGAIGGTIEVEITGDNDYIGFVMGFGADDSTEFILFDWKQGCQSGSFPGFVLSRVTGGANAIPFGSHSSSSAGYEVLATNTGACAEVMGWEDNTPYDIIIEYNSDRIVVKVSGMLCNFRFFFNQTNF